MRTPAARGGLVPGPRDAREQPDTVRIVHLCDYVSPYPGSFVPMLQSVRTAVERRGWGFEAVFASGAGEREWYRALERDAMRVRVSPARSRGARPGWVRALLAEDARPAVLHTHFAGWDLPAVLAARGHRGRSPVTVLWHRHGILSRRPWPLARDLARFGVAGRAVDAHLCVGPEPRSQLLARGAPPGRTFLFANPVDVPRFPLAGAEERSAARSELQVDRDAELIVAFTWEWERKGGPLLVELARELAARGRAVTVLAVGARLDAGPLVRAVAPRPDPRPFFAAADVFLAPSRAEAFGFAPHESICCGTPVVASDVPGHRHFGTHLPAMQLMPLAVDAIADAVEWELGADGHDRARRIAESRDYLKRHAGVDAWVRRLLHVYVEALARRGVTGADAGPR